MTDAEERIRDFVDEIEDVPGVSGVRPVLRSDAAYASLNVANDYGNRDEYGDGDVALSDPSTGTDPVGGAAFKNRLRIVRVTPKPDEEKTKYWFAPAEDLDAAMREP